MSDERDQAFYEIDAFVKASKDISGLPMIDCSRDPQGYTSAYPEAYEAVKKAHLEAKAKGIPLIMPAWPARKLNGPGT